MKHCWLRMLMVLVTAVTSGGCARLFPTQRAATASRWQSYAEVQAAFDRVELQRTTLPGLKTLGFDPTASPNVKILTYVDIMLIFMPNPAIRKEDLAEPVRACIEAKEKSHAYSVDLQDTTSKRHGNLILDILGFKRKTHETGWRFKGLILVKDDVVVYKLASGEPQISSDKKQIKPLGPVQELDPSFLLNFAK
jgi:hypothetical protein